MKIKEHKLPFDSFIGGWFIDNKICDNLISLHQQNIEHTQEGKTMYDDVESVNKSIKDSKDLILPPDHFEYPVDKYRDSLQKCLEKYIKKYKYVNGYSRFNIKENYSIQYYPPKGGYKVFHFENAAKETSKRILVFMTYLNDVEDAGTEFYYQKLKTPCKKGLTLIWPAGFTHTHKGIVNKKKNKYIVTGWFSY
tara:strand:+ start:2803 stop:3384 length:582 start_codon:yes stop_codon:yes gene_type:complete